MKAKFNYFLANAGGLSFSNYSGTLSDDYDTIGVSLNQTVTVVDNSGNLYFDSEITDINRNKNEIELDNSTILNVHKIVFLGIK